MRNGETNNNNREPQLFVDGGLHDAYVNPSLPQHNAAGSFTLWSWSVHQINQFMDAAHQFVGQVLNNGDPAYNYEPIKYE